MKQAKHEADDACNAADHDAKELEKAQEKLAHARKRSRRRRRRRSPRCRPRSTRATAAAAASAADVHDRHRDRRRPSSASFDGFNDGTKHEGTPTVTENDPFPDNYVHSDNVELVGHVRGITGGSPSCPAFNPTKCPAFSSLNFVTGYKNLGYDIMVANGTGGLAVWSLKDPAHPAVHLGDPVRPARDARRAARRGRSSGKART